MAVVERARELMQGGGERNVLPAGKGGGKSRHHVRASLQQNLPERQK